MINNVPCDSLSLRGVRAGMEGRDLEAGTEAKIHEQTQLTGLLHVASSVYFLMQLRTTCPGKTQWAGPCQNNHVENALQTCSQASVMKSYSQVTFLTSCVTLTSVELTKTYSAQRIMFGLETSLLASPLGWRDSSRKLPPSCSG